MWTVTSADFTNVTNLTTTGLNLFFQVTFVNSSDGLSYLVITGLIVGVNSEDRHDVVCVVCGRLSSLGALNITRLRGQVKT